MATLDLTKAPSLKSGEKPSVSGSTVAPLKDLQKTSSDQTKFNKTYNLFFEAFGKLGRTSYLVCYLVGLTFIPLLLLKLIKNKFYLSKIKTKKGIILILSLSILIFIFWKYDNDLAGILLALIGLIIAFALVACLAILLFTTLSNISAKRLSDMGRKDKLFTGSLAFKLWPIAVSVNFLHMLFTPSKKENSPPSFNKDNSPFKI